MNIESGQERKLTVEKFFNIKSLAWLPDGSGVLITASRIPNKHFRIWQVSAASGEATPLTKDSETYWELSLDRTASRLVVTQTKQDFRLHLLKFEDPSARVVLGDASSASFGPDGNIIFSSLMTGNDEIWSVLPDGSGRRQLTNDPADDIASAVSPDGNSIFFCSNRSGEVEVWRMNSDGSAQTQITTNGGGNPLFVSPDGRWLYYHHNLNKTLWRISVDGGEEALVLDRRKHHFAISPDGLQAAFPEQEGDAGVLAVVSIAEGRAVKTFKLAVETADLVQLKWSPDGEDLAYVLAVGEFENKTLWFQPLNGKAPTRVAELGDGYISGSGFAFAPDRKSLALVQGGWQHDAVLLHGLK